MYAEECLTLAKESGSRRRIANTLGNLAHIAGTHGDFATAKRFLDQCLELLDPKDPARLAALSTGLSISLATRDLSVAATIVEHGVELFGAEVEPSYYQLWFEISRVRWLIESGRPGVAIAVAEEAVQAVIRLADKELRERFRLLAAECHGRSDNLEKAKGLFAEACSESSHAGLEVLAEKLRVGAELSVSENPRDAAWLLSVAFRLLTSASLLGQRAAIERSAELLNVQVDSPTADSEPAVTAFGLILKLGRHPGVLGRELIALLRRNSSGIVAFLLEETGKNSSAIESTTPDHQVRYTSRHDDVKLFLAIGDQRATGCVVLAQHRFPGF